MIVRTWRDRFAPVIHDVLEAHRGQPLRAKRKALRAAFTYGERRDYSYRVWLDEIRRQLKLPRRRRKSDLAGQLVLFD